MRTAILVNTLTSINSFAYSNHIGFFNETKAQFPNDEFRLITPQRMSIDFARNLAAKVALAEDFDYLMFLDDDVLVPRNTFKNLIKCDADIASGLVIIRGYPFDVMGFKFTNKSTLEEPRLENYNDLPRILKDKEVKIGDKIELEDNEPDINFNSLPLKEIIDVAAVGFSCALIKVDLLKQFEDPYFVTGINVTEDIYFCMKAYQRLKGEVTIRMNTSIRCGHILTPEVIEWDTRNKFKEFYRETMEKQEAMKPKHPRNLQFLERTLQTLK